MALTKTQKLSIDTRYSITLTVTEKAVTSEDIALNRTRVDYKLEATKSKGTGYYSGSAINPVKVTINGKKVVDKKVTYDFQTSTSTSKTITLASGTEPIQHNSDGSKTISCSASFEDKANGLGSASVSGNLTLTPLHTPPLITGYTITEINTALTNIGVANNEFVSNLSQKNINIAVTYDDANLNYCCLYYEGLLHQSLTNPMTFNFATFPTNLEKNTFDCAVYVEDTQGGYSYYSNATGLTQSKPTLDSYTLIPYIKPSFTVTSNAKRDGQTSGKVDLNIDGVYFNGEIGSGANKVNQGGTYKPTIKYKFWKYGETEPDSYAYEINTEDIITNDGTFSVISYPIGNATEGTPNHFDPDYAYRVKLYVQDTFTNTESGELSIPVGEATWTEYRDRVDFKRITRQNHEIYGETVLFNTDTATTSNITLSDSAANYEYIDVYYLWSSNSGRLFNRIYEPNGNTINLQGLYDNGTYGYYAMCPYSFSGTSMTRGTEVRWRWATGGGNNTRGSGTDNIRVLRVVGYK